VTEWTRMANRRVDIVVTTIFEPKFLDGYV
jgi:hypothetical protein